MWRRQAALALNGTTGIQASGKGLSSYAAPLPTPTGRSVQQCRDACTNIEARTDRATTKSPTTPDAPSTPKICNKPRKIEIYLVLNRIARYACIRDISRREKWLS